MTAIAQKLADDVAQMIESFRVGVARRLIASVNGAPAIGVKRGPGRPRQTHCKRGHDLNDSYVSPRGIRFCRQCKALHSAAHYRAGQVLP